MSPSVLCVLFIYFTGRFRSGYRLPTPCYHQCCTFSLVTLPVDFGLAKGFIHHVTISVVHSLWLLYRSISVWLQATNIILPPVLCLLFGYLTGRFLSGCRLHTPCYHKCCTFSLTTLPVDFGLATGYQQRATISVVHSLS